ncbi:MerR family transcriptional regulator [Clostridiaceae bacterium M8S5]|nr:MerR family transcriptional regulator [Clostridiaceae bacterium M8S5]
MDKRYLISEIAKMFNITTNKLRFYEKKGVITSSRDDENNYRYYTNDDLLKIQLILIYRQIGFSINDIKKLLNKDYKDDVINHFYNQWNIINNEVHRLRLLRDSVEGVMDIIYDNKGDEYIEKLIETINKMNEVKDISDNWKDKWDFDSWAKRYDSSVESDDITGIFKNYYKVLQTVYEKSIENISDKPEQKRVLDIGIGTGNLTKKYLDSGYNIVGLDQSREMLNVAKQKHPNLKVRLGEFLKIPFDNSQFDIIVSTYAFHHLNEDEKRLAIKEMLRVLKEKGKIVIGDLMYENESEKIKLQNTSTKEQIEAMEDEYYSNIEELENELRKYSRKLASCKIDRVNFVVVIE